MKLIDLVEGIVSRTSQHDQKTKAAIDVLSTALAPDWSNGKMQQFSNAIYSLTGFLDVSPPNELGWFFEKTFEELDIDPEHQEQTKAAMLYIAQRFNALLADDVASSLADLGPESANNWLYSLWEEIGKQANIKYHSSSR